MPSPVVVRSEVLWWKFPPGSGIWGRSSPQDEKKARKGCWADPSTLAAVHCTILSAWSDQELIILKALRPCWKTTIKGIWLFESQGYNGRVGPSLCWAKTMFLTYFFWGGDKDEHSFKFFRKVSKYKHMCAHMHNYGYTSRRSMDPLEPTHYGL